MSTPADNPADREETLFAAVVDLPAAERGGYLDQHCDGDAALRRRVEALLLANQAADDLLDAPVSGGTSLARQMVRDGATVKEKAGDRIGNYNLVKEVGVGGCGVVYLAEQEKPVRRQVALKVIKLGMDTRQVVARFEFERQTLALMDHPHIAQVFDAGETDAGRPYFVMEFVEGVRVTRFCDERNLSTQARLELFLQVCLAIQHAHQKGIIHRDIKPSNILVREVDGAPLLKVIDFGIAKATDQQRLAGNTVFTMQGQFIGTPAYMSPEQVGVEGVDMDTRSDIYSLGVLLYELLTGTTPLDSEHLSRLGLENLCRTLREHEPHSPSSRLTTLGVKRLAELAGRHNAEAARLLQALRGDLDWIVMKALEKDRTRRYESVSALAEDVRRYLGNQPVLARPASPVYLFRKLVRRHRLAFAAGAVIAASLILGLAISTRLYFEEQTARLRAEHAEDRAGKALREMQLQRDAARKAEAEALASKQRADQEAEVAIAIRDLLRTDILGQVGTWAQEAGGYVPDPNLTIRVAVERAASRVGNRFQGRPAIEADVRLTIGEAFLAMQEPEKALEHLERAFAYKTKTLGVDHPETIRAMRFLSKSYLAMCRYDQAIKLYEEAVGFMEAKWDYYDIRLITEMGNLGYVYLQAGKHDLALSILEENMERRRAMPGGGDVDLAYNLNQLGAVYRTLGKPDAELAAREEAVQLSRKRFGKQVYATITVEGSLGRAYIERQRYDEGLPLLEEVIKYEQSLAVDSPVAVTLMNEVAGFYETAGKFERAFSLYKEVFKHRSAKLGAGHPDAQTVLGSLANVSMRAGRQADAEKVLIRTGEELYARRFDLSLGSTGRAQIVSCLQRLIQFYTQWGKPANAAEWQAKLDGLPKN